MSGLTTGAVYRTFKGDLNHTPNLQIMDIKKIGGPSSERYRLVLSDGQCYQQAMVATQLNSKITNGEIKEGCIIKLNQFVTNEVANRSIVIILNLDVVSPGPGQNIGDPMSVEVYAEQQANKPQQAAPQVQRSMANNPYMNQARAAPLPIEEYQPIAQLNIYNSNWTIKARVTSKTDIRTWSNARGEGKLFSMDLLDAEGGQIRCTAFNDACDKFFPMINEGSVYSIAGGTLKVANQAYSPLPNDYEITLDSHSDIKFLGDDNSIATQKFDFANLEQISQLQANEIVDVIGVVEKVTPIAEILSRSGKQLLKRTITLRDQSLLSIELTIWGNDAEKYNEQELAGNPIMAVKMCKVSDFNGKSLGTQYGSKIFVNPDRKEAHSLRSWYENTGREAKVETLSKGMRGSGPAPRKFFSQIKGENLGFKEKADVFQARATVTFIKNVKDKVPWYNACPSADCNKKVVEDGSNQFFCAKCDRTYPNCQPRYIVSLLCADATESSWFTAFNEAGETLLGVTAQEMANHLANGNIAKYDSIITSANFQTYNLKIRAKAEFNQDQQQLRCTILNVSPVDYRAESRHLLEQIASF